MRNITLSILTIVLFLVIGFFVLNTHNETVVEEEINLIGLWESDDDSLFTREFLDGSVIDRYNNEDDVETQGDWKYISGEEILAKGFKYISGEGVIKIQFNEDPEPLYFSILKTGENTISMIFLNGNGILNFTRIDSPIETELKEISLISPTEGSKITSPLKITGEAPGTWFFEASFPVTLTDWDGKIIAEGYVMSQGDWMTTEMVSFEGEIEFEKPVYGERGTLILQKDNPSGLPEFDKAYEITVFFE